MRPMKGAALMTSGTTVAVGPRVVPSSHMVKGSTVISRMMNGTERTMFTIAPSTVFTGLQGFRPFLSVTYRATPMGRPST